MAIDLLKIQPHKVSKDLGGYITFIYGKPKTGKTTLATQMPKSLLLAFEQGYNCLPGVMAADITSWTEMKQVYRDLKRPEVKEAYDAIIVDTIDEAAKYCEKYICNQNGIESLGDLGYGKGWIKFKDEFNEVFRGLTRLGYAVFFLGHEKEQTINRPDGTEANIIRPNLSQSTRTVITGMADIYGYAHQKGPGQMSVLTLRSGTDAIDCGGRFKYIEPEIPMSYENLVNAIHAAIDKEAEETKGKFVTDEKMTVAPEAPTYDYEGLMNEFQQIASELMAKNSEYYAPRVTKIVEKYLGKGKKISETSIDQAEFVSLIIDDIKDELMNK